MEMDKEKRKKRMWITTKFKIVVGSGWEGEIEFWEEPIMSFIYSCSILYLKQGSS